jgi:hypothetical protein
MGAAGAGPSRQSSQPGPISQGSINGQTRLVPLSTGGTSRNDRADIGAFAPFFDRAGRRVSIAAGVTGADVLVVRREYCRMDLVMQIPAASRRGAGPVLLRHWFGNDAHTFEPARQNFR